MITLTCKCGKTTKTFRFMKKSDFPNGWETDCCLEDESWKETPEEQTEPQPELAVYVPEEPQEEPEEPQEEPEEPQEEPEEPQEEPEEEPSEDITVPKDPSETPETSPESEVQEEPKPAIKKKTRGRRKKES